MLKGYITNLGKYNEGILQGEWVDFPISEEELEEVLKRIGINEEYEEFFFTDWESELDLFLDAYENIDCINVLAESLEEFERYDEMDKLAAIMEATGDNVFDAITYMADAVFYPGMTLEDVAYEIANDCYFTRETPDFLVRYFDYEAFARDLKFDGYTETDFGVIFTN